MHIRTFHPWRLAVQEAKTWQQRLAGKVKREGTPQRLQVIAAADISSSRFSKILHGALVVCRLPDMRILEAYTARTSATFPYIPGLLSFRETPVLLPLFKQVKIQPDVLLVDGHGYAHPRRFGIACHLGLILDLPTIGVAKRALVGSYYPPAAQAKSTSPLTDQGEVVGTVLRSQAEREPIFISVGHRLNLEEAVRVVLACLRKYRLPEPSRLAHLLANAARRGETVAQFLAVHNRRFSFVSPPNQQSTLPF
jgi:deoxyribonuclease V